MSEERGITLVELTMVIGILLAIFALGGFALSRFMRSTAAVSSDREIMNALTVAARRARSGSAGTPWGVYIPYDETSRSTDSIVVFSGASYAARNVSFDTVLSVSPDIAFSAVDFSGSAPDVTNSHEIVFAPLTGTTSQFGSLTIEWYEASATITIPSNGIPIR